MIPLISLLRKDFEVIMAAGGNARLVIKNAFPDLQCCSLPGMKITYPGSNFMKGALTIIPSFLFHTLREYLRTRRLVEEIKPDIIISDNRYGVFNKRSLSIIITHQLFVCIPGVFKIFSPAVSYALKKACYFFDECWIPDIPGEYSLSGMLSGPALKMDKCFYTGWLSHFSTLKNLSSDADGKQWRIIAVISGPEPQRSIFEEILTKQLSAAEFPSLMVCGLPENSHIPPTQSGNLKKIPYLKTGELLDAINRSGTVICRSGYSSVADMATLGKRAIFIPTPGQPEQEYLAGRLKQKGWYYSEEQGNFDLLRALEFSEKYRFPDPGNKRDLLEGLIQKLKNQKR